MTDNELIRVPVRTRASITHLGSLDSFDITAGGKKAAGLILKYLEGDRTKVAPLTQAIQIYDKLIPNENFGGEYTALQRGFGIGTEINHHRVEVVARLIKVGGHIELWQDARTQLRLIASE